MFNSSLIIGIFEKIHTKFDPEYDLVTIRTTRGFRNSQNQFICDYIHCLFPTEQHKHVTLDHSHKLLVRGHVETFNNQLYIIADSWQLLPD